jgi:deoxyribose-phosphate aldolase
MEAIKEILAFSAENTVKSVLINYVLANKKVKSIKETTMPDVYIEFPLGTCINEFMKLFFN